MTTPATENRRKSDYDKRGDGEIMRPERTLRLVVPVTRTRCVRSLSGQSQHPHPRGIAAPRSLLEVVNDPDYVATHAPW